jgi:hypothetical protein
MEHFFGVAKENGLNDEAIGAVQAIAMGVSAGRIRAQFRQVREQIGYDEGPAKTCSASRRADGAR